jgi:hypothetical protein
MALMMAGAAGTMLTMLRAHLDIQGCGASYDEAFRDFNAKAIENGFVVQPCDDYCRDDQCGGNSFWIAKYTLLRYHISRQMSVDKYVVNATGASFEPLSHRQMTRKLAKRNKPQAARRGCNLM